MAIHHLEASETHGEVEGIWELEGGVWPFWKAIRRLGAKRGAGRCETAGKTCQHAGRAFSGRRYVVSKLGRLVMRWKGSRRDGLHVDARNRSNFFKPGSESSLGGVSALGLGSGVWAVGANAGGVAWRMTSTWQLVSETVHVHPNLSF